MEKILPPRYRNQETDRIEGTHAVFLGQTGFGKTFLATKFLEHRKFVVVHDGKRTFREKELKGDWGFYDHVEQCIRADENRICYSPSRDELRDRAAQDYFWEWILRRGYTTTYVDEGVLVSDGQRIPDAMFDNFATGRENGNEIWVATQQPVELANIIFTQSGAFYVFYHSVEGHRKKVRSFVPIVDSQVEKLDREQFYAYGQNWRRPVGPLHYNSDDHTIERIAA